MDYLAGDRNPMKMLLILFYHPTYNLTIKTGYGGIFTQYRLD